MRSGFEQMRPDSGGAALAERESLPSKLKLAGKIWLSVGIFVLGFMFFVLFGQYQGASTELRLRMASNVLYPAALKSHEAVEAFSEALKTFFDAVVMNDVADLDRGCANARRAAELLRSLAGLSSSFTRAGQATVLASQVDRFTTRAAHIYRKALKVPSAIPPEVQKQIWGLSTESAGLRRAVEALQNGCADDLRELLATVETRSRRLRKLGLGIFATTLLLSAALVNMTIRRAIARPLATAEAELAHERDLLRILLDNTPDAIYFKDTEGRFIRINKAQAALLGVGCPEDACGHTEFDYFPHEHARSSYRDERNIVQSGRAMVSKIEYIELGRTPRWLASTKAPVRDERGRITCMVCISRDITEWKQTVDALKASEETFRLLFAVIPHAVCVYDAETLDLLEFNEGVLCQYGYSGEELRRMRLPDLFAPEDVGRLRETLSRLGPDNPLEGVWKHRTKDNLHLDVEISARLLEFRNRPSVLVLVEDISERRRLELELQQAQRLEAVGHLAAGIAHEINTPIQYVGDNLRFLQDAFAARQAMTRVYERLRREAQEAGIVPELLRELDRTAEQADIEYLNQEIPNAVAQSMDGVHRVATIVRAMKEFAHPGRKEKAAADLNKALASALIVAHNEIKYLANVETHLGELPPVVCHIAEINQVILNLLVNAAHAIGEVKDPTSQRGVIAIRTWQAGQEAVVSISDTGCGIPDEIKARVFDPFFTTKEVGRGTGQGLTLARSIIEKHGGSIGFEPNGERGTTFTFRLPLNTPAAFQEDAAPARLGVGADL